MKNVMQIAMVCLLLVLFIDGMVWPPACIASDEADSPDAGPPAHPPIVRGFMSGHIREGHFRDMRAFGANVVRLQIDVVRRYRASGGGASGRVAAGAGQDRILGEGCDRAVSG